MSTTVEAGAADGVGGDVDDGIGAGECVERHGGGGTKGSFPRRTGTIGDVEADLVAADGNQCRAFDSLIPGEVRKCHASNLGRRTYVGT